ncbi:MAG: ABC transporter ATP-binding protein [Spirosomataceae bacterium]
MPYILEAQHIHKQYANHTALNDVSINVPQGGIFGLLGPNGAGKTSLIRIINQITAPDSGIVLFDGKPLSPNDVERIGYLPEERGLYKKMKVGEQLLYLAQLKGMSKQEANVKLKNWFEKFDISDWWNRQVDDLSKGMQQKAQFIATIIHDPQLIILDEPFSGFDPINANLLKDEILALKAKGTSIIFSTHRMESVEELCDDIALINHAEVVLQGTKKAIKNQFKDNSYLLDFVGEMPTLPESITLLGEQELEDNQTRIHVRLQHEMNPNSLIFFFLDKVEVKAFCEKIPSFNEIFIQVVGQK